MIPSFRWNSGSSSSTPLRDSTSTRSASSWASLAEYLTRGFLEQPYPDARLHPLQHLGHAARISHAASRPSGALAPSRALGATT